MGKLYAVCTTLDAGTDSDKSVMKNLGIEIGDKIEVENVLVKSYETIVWLKGYEDYELNSVFFDFVDELGKPYDVYHNRDFYSWDMLLRG